MAKGRRRLDMDRISELPESVLQLILARMPIRDAVATSIFSSKWRCIWTGIPELVFDGDFDKSLDEEDLVSTIYAILLQHRGPTVEFTLEMLRLPSSPQIDHVINFISRNGLEHLKLVSYHTIRYKLPSSLFFCNSLKRLNLSNCEFRIPQMFKEFSRLTSLECDGITVDSNEFNTFITACPMLRVLSLKRANDIDLEIISALQLEYLYVDYFASLSLENVPLLSTLIITCRGRETVGPDIPEMADMPEMANIDFFASLAAIEVLELSFHIFQSAAASGIPAKLPCYLTHLRRVKFVQIDFSNPDEVSGVLCLIRSAPNLRCLDIEMHIHWGPDAHSVLELLTAQGFSDVIWDKLESVEMHHLCDQEPEIEFIKFLFAKSPVLRRMVIRTALVSEGVQLTIMKKLARFPRASGNAELIFLDG